MIITSFKNFLLVKPDAKAPVQKLRISDLTVDAFKALKPTVVKFNGQWLSENNRTKINEFKKQCTNVKFEQLSQVSPIDDLEAHYQAMINFQPKKAKVIELSKEQQKSIIEVVKATNKSSVNKFIRSITTK